MHELLGLLTIQQDTINKQSKMIVELLNENMEKENMINVLMNEFNDG